MGYDIGPRLRRFRETRRLSQKEFADLIGVSNSRVSNWEQGINRPDVDRLAKICEVLKVSPNELLDIGDCYSLSLDAKDVAIAYDKADFKSKNIARQALDLPALKEDEFAITDKRTAV